MPRENPSQFDAEGRKLLHKEVGRRAQEKSLDTYDNPIDTAEANFRKVVVERGWKQDGLNRELEILRAQWEKVKESSRDTAVLEEALDDYLVQGRKIEEGLRVTADSVVENGDQRPGSLEQGKKIDIASINPKDPGKWGKLFHALRQLGGAQGSDKFYGAEELISIINGVREHKKSIGAVTAGGDLDLNNKVISFLAEEQKASARAKGVKNPTIFVT